MRWTPRCATGPVGPRAVGRVLQEQLLPHLAPAQGPLIFGLAETLARGTGPRIAAQGVYRDGVRSSRGHFVQAMGLTEIPWAPRVWALPFLTVLAPSARYAAARGRRHQTLTDWARQMRRCLRRGLPDRDLVVVADRAYAALHLLAACQRLARPVTVIPRLRLDAARYDTPPPGRRTATLIAPAAHRSGHGLGGGLPGPWGDGAIKSLAVATGVALWYRPGQTPVRRLLRFVLIPP